jgi:hypothetical protein
MASTLARFESSEFLPMGTPKTPCVTAPVDNEEAFHHRILNTCQTTCNNLGLFEWMWSSMTRRVEAWIESHGGYLEHLS